MKFVDKTKNPDETKKVLETLLPKEKWKRINRLFVSFGQSICKADKPKCGDCLLNKICDVGIENLRNSSKKRDQSIEKKTTNLKRKTLSKESKNVKKKKN